jgi:twinkle protein
MELLEARGLDIELCVRLGLETASAPDGGDSWVAIPFVRNGAVVNHKYRRIEKLPDGPNFAQDKGGAQCWWNHDVLLDSSLGDQPLVITEGEFDGITAIQAGFVRTLSVPGGAPEAPVQGDGKYGFLADTLPLIGSCRRIILATDGDRQGVALMNDLAKRLGRGRCQYVVWPPGCKDLNDVLRLIGPAAVVRALNEARFVAVPGLFTMAELPPVETPEPYAIGIAGLADHFRMRLGDLSVLTGVPSTGKSTLVNDIACRMAERHGWATCFASPEQNPQIDHRRALRTWINRKPADKQSPGELEIADAWINDHFSFVVGSDDEDFDLEWLLDKLASAVVRYDAKLCVIDPWNELDHAKPKDATMTEYVGWAIRQLKKFARKWNVHMMVVAHPSKMIKQKDGSVPKPTLYDVSDSAHWYNKPDVGLVIHPERTEDGAGYTSLSVVKSRYHDMIGRPGIIKLTFNPYTGRFESFT